MSDKRVIKVNPDLFKITNSTKKKRQKESKDIKIKTKRANNQTMKRKLLNLIRSKQDEKIKTNNRPVWHYSCSARCLKYSYS